MGEYKKLNIKDWAVEDRPRAKLMDNGSRSLTDAELLAIIIGSGNKDESAVELSRRILNTLDNDLNNLGKQSFGYLTGFKGIGEAKAINILATLELGKRRKETQSAKQQSIRSSSDVAEIFFPLLTDLQHEEFWVLLLNRASLVIDKQMVSQGGISGTVIDVRLIMKIAIEKLASSIILCHNHPSGNLDPSEADRQITNKLKEAGKVMDLPVLDHIIIAQKKYFSFADEAML